MDGSASACQLGSVTELNGGSSQLPYGLAEDGRLAHVSEVASGLACGCRCPGCGEPLVARKGGRKVHHFAHHVDRACAGAWETTLHRLAKEVVLEAREILLPAACAEIGDLRQEVAAAMTFHYESSKAEVDLDGLRPDAVVRRRGRELLLEFWVTNPCNDEKKGKLRQRNLPAVEINLRQVPRHASRAEHAEHILRAAPRHWLHNAKLAAVEARLRREVETRAEAERRRKHHFHSRVADEVAAAWTSPAERSASGWLTRTRGAGFGEFAGTPVPGGQCFAFDTSTWQAAFLYFAVVSLAGNPFTAENALGYLQRCGMLKEPFTLRRNWARDLVAHLRECVEGFRSPIEVVADYADWLVERGVLARTHNGWRADAERGWEARRRIDGAEAGRRRETELRAKVILLLKVAQNTARAARPWMDRVLPEFGKSPRSLALAGGDRFEDIMRRLRELEGMAWAGGDPVEGGLLGLPLEELRRMRQAEAHARQERQCRLREEFAAQTRERRRKESVDFVDALSVEAAGLLGAEAGRAWVENAVRSAVGTTFDEARLNLDRATRARVNGALGEERRRTELMRQAAETRGVEEAVVTAETLRCRAELTERALRRFSGEADLTQLWLRGTQRAFGQSPWAHCTDERRLAECMRLLDVVAPNGARRR